MNRKVDHFEPFHSNNALKVGAITLVLILTLLLLWCVWQAPAPHKFP